MTTYRLKRKTFAFGFSSLGKAISGMSTSASQAARLEKIVAAGHGGMKVGGTTAAQALDNTKNVSKNLTKGLAGLGATAAVGAGAVGTYNTFTGNVGNDN